VDNRCNLDSSVVNGICEQLHDGRVYSHPAGSCDYHSTGQRYFGAPLACVFFFIRSVCFVTSADLQSMISHLQKGVKK
jgi:hypothetical protein